MSESLNNKLNKIRSIILAVVFGLIPLVFLPLTQDFYDTNKWMLLLVSALILFILWTIQMIISKSFSLSWGGSSIGFIAMFLSLTLSTLISSPNKVEALLAPFGVITYLALTIIFVARFNILDLSGKKILKIAFLGSTGVISLITIYQFFGVGKIMFPSVTYLADEAWTPTGSSFALLSLLFISLPLAIDWLVKSIKSRHEGTIAVLSIVVILLTIGTLLTLIKIVPQLGQLMLPFSQGWAIALEVFKNPARALFGVGPESFISAFTAGRNQAVNITPLWNIRFVTSSSLLLHTMATTGIFGTIAILFFLKSLFPGIPKSGVDFSLYIALIIAIAFPPTFVFIAAVAVLLLLKEDSLGRGIEKPLTGRLTFLKFLTPIMVILISVASTYSLIRLYNAELTFFQSLIALQNNNGTQTYNLQIKALEQNPYLTRYRLAYSQTNLALANALAQTAQTNGASGISDTDRQTISALIQQAIREAKIAVNLAPENVLAWENLARIYQNLINVASGSDQWAVAAWQRAVQLDPSNPMTRISLGGIYLQVNDLDAATLQFQNAAVLKPDWANSHYNLAYAYNQKKEYYKAATELTQTLSQLPASSTDRQRVMTELDTVKKNLKPNELAQLEGKPPPAALGADSTITQPNSPANQTLPVITPKIQLPKESSPASTVGPAPTKTLIQ